MQALLKWLDGHLIICDSILETKWHLDFLNRTKYIWMKEIHMYVWTFTSLWINEWWTFYLWKFFIKDGNIEQFKEWCHFTQNWKPLNELMWLKSELSERVKCGSYTYTYMQWSYECWNTYLNVLMVIYVIICNYAHT